MKLVLLFVLCVAGILASDDWNEEIQPTLTLVDATQLNPELASPLIAVESSSSPAHHQLLDFNHENFLALSQSLSLSDKITLKGFSGHDLELTAVTGMLPGTKVQWVDENGVEEAKEPQELLSLSGKVVGHDDSFAVLNLSPVNSYGFIHIGEQKLWLESHPNSHAVLVDISANPTDESEDEILDALRKNFKYDEPKTESHDMDDTPAAPGVVPAVMLEAADEEFVEDYEETAARDKDTVFVAIECDKSCYDRISGQGFNDVERYLRAITAATSAIYKRDLGRDLQISYMKVNKASNEYGSSSSDLGNILAVFAQKFNRDKRAAGVCFDVAHLFTGSGSGGLAAKGSVCKKSDNNGGVSTIFGKWKGESTSSASNWDLIVSLHEIGHNLGSPHTHSYNPPLDNCVACAAGVAKAKGTCGGSDAKPVARTDKRCVRGTIMSYCHLCGGNAHIDMRFSQTEQAVMERVMKNNCGPLPGERAAPCTDQQNGCPSWYRSNGAKFCDWNLNAPVQGPANQICCSTCKKNLGEAETCTTTTGAKTWTAPAFVCKDGSPSQCPSWAGAGYCNGGTLQDAAKTPISKFCGLSCKSCEAGGSKPASTPARQPAATPTRKPTSKPASKPQSCSDIGSSCAGSRGWAKRYNCNGRYGAPVSGLLKDYCKKSCNNC